MKCIWCGEPAGLVISIVLNEKGVLSGGQAICWPCIYEAAKKRVGKKP